MDTQYDVVVVGSGLGGLVCGALFAREGYSVCVLERNKQIGGNLQTFVRDKVIFDSGVHYVGGLEKGQNLYQIFKYLGIMDKLKIHKMDDDIVDGIVFGENKKVYRLGQGYDRFIANLVADFPEEEEAIVAYCEKIRSICLRFPFYNLRTGNSIEKDNVLAIDAKEYLESITQNKTLQNVLAGSNLLYAGEGNKSPLYVHALIINSYIEGSYRFINGGSQIARFLTREIVSRKGAVKTGKNVTKLEETDGVISYAECENGERYYGKYFISNAHPSKTLEITESKLIRKVYRNRINGLENSISVFSINIVLKKNTFKYKNHNIYYYGKEDVWGMVDYKAEDWPMGFALFFSTASPQGEYADGITLMTYMRFSETLAWKDTFNTVLKEENRGAEYEQFKEEKAVKLLELAYRILPELKESIASYYTATPLTLRDYIGTDDGSLYGVVKDYHEPLKTFISPRTKIPNLFLTGQNLNLHGVLGVSISAIVTSAEILGMDTLLEKIRNA